MESTGEDPGKKRSKEEHGAEEKSKKVRVNHFSEAKDASIESTATAIVNHLKQKEVAQSSGGMETNSAEGRSERKYPQHIWDLESALHVLVQEEGNCREYLSTPDADHPESIIPWIRFRAGHAGDASTIAQWHRKSMNTKNAVHPIPETAEIQVKESNNNVSPVSGERFTADAASESANHPGGVEEEHKASMLEVWLADGLGNESIPPTLHALLVHVHQPVVQDSGNSDVVESHLAGVALMTMSWGGHHDRILRIEWMHLELNLMDSHSSNVLRERFWLRLSILAKMTACDLVLVDGQHTKPAARTTEITRPAQNRGKEGNNVKEGPTPSSE